ncbi:hypothetical protein ACQ4M3_19815 [Leptolyngbya sp. AN03gr2]|uniref:hypothetical protein n=1 Tax=unclassified Leptolyngbya TaxID=2650499 RepID=UPI003D3191EF
MTMLPTSLVEPLKLYLERVRRAHQLDLDRGYGSVHLPFALERKYPHADNDDLHACPESRRERGEKSA